MRGLVVMSLLISCVYAGTSVYMMKSGSGDQASSASGYSYHSASGHPISYVQVNSGPDFGNPVPIAHYVQSYPAPAPAPLYTHVAEPEEAQSSDFVKEGGEEYGSAHKSAHGEKGEKGYKNEHEYSEGEKGNHENEGEEGHYAAEGGEKAGHHDEGSHYSKHHESEDGNKGEKYGSSEYHKKGHKTEGYHKVYRKDEFKKDHTFYDEADKSGHFEKHGNFNKNHEDAEGAFKKGASHHSGYHGDHYGKKGFHDKGRYNQHDQGYKGQQGNDAHHSSGSQYANEEGKSGGSQHGHSESDGAVKYYE